MKRKEFFAKAARGASRQRRTADGRFYGDGAAKARPVRGSVFRVALLLLLILSGLAGFCYWHSRNALPGPYARVAVSLESLETATADNQPSGLSTSYPLNVCALEAPDARFVTVSGEAVRLAAVSNEPVPTSDFLHTRPLALPSRGLLHFSGGSVSIQTMEGPVPVFRLGGNALAAYQEDPDIFQADHFSGACDGDGQSPRPGLYGEVSDDGGLPLRWPQADFAAFGEARYCDISPGKGQALMRALVRGLSVPGAEAFYRGNAGQYTGHARRYAEKYGLALPLVLAIMHTESNFNPFAVSRSRAVGLMQIVPDTAGNEAHRYLTGSFGPPSLDLLFSPEHNIRYGTAYLHLLARRYFGGVQDGRSRQMCMIAAYNGGPGAVLRLFDPGDPQMAVARINSMTPEQIYATLTNDMPNMETRRYVELVLDRMRGYGVH